MSNYEGPEMGSSTSVLKKLLKALKRLPPIALFSCALLILVYLHFGVVRPIAESMRSLSSQFSSSYGQFVGEMDGLKEGLEVDVPKGKADGEDAALNIDSTSVSTPQINALGSGELEVLRANIRLRVANIDGAEYKGRVVEIARIVWASITGKDIDTTNQKPSYARLSSYDGEVIFKIPLSSAWQEFSEDGRKLTVHLPEPKASITIDESSLREIAKYTGKSNGLSSERELTGLLNSRAQQVKGSEEALENYSVYLDLAKSSAERSIPYLVRSASLRNIVVEVKFDVDTKEG